MSISGNTTPPGDTVTSTFAALFAGLYVAHHLGDYWVQTNTQATTKTLPGRVGRRACLAHVTTYTITAVLVLTVVAWRLDLVLDPGRAAIGLGVSAVTHYLADRRVLLRRLAVLAHHDGPWLDTGGLALMDQSWHIAWLFAAALIMT